MIYMGADVIGTGALMISGDFVHGRRDDSLFDISRVMFCFLGSENLLDRVLLGCRKEMGATSTCMYWTVGKGRGSAPVISGAYQLDGFCKLTAAILQIEKLARGDYERHYLSS
jgi:hypothetical protein